MRSFKLRPFDAHVWIVREGEPGATLRGDAAARAFTLGAPLFELASPGAPERVRALSVDLASARLLATLSAEQGKPTPVRVDGPEVLAAVTDALRAYLQGSGERVATG